MSRLRFFALLRIKPCSTACGPRQFWVSTLRSYSPGGVLNALAAALRGGNLPTLKAPSFVAWTTRVSNPVHTHAFEPQHQLQTREPPSPLVFFHISTHSTATQVPLSSSASRKQFPMQFSVKPGLSHQTCFACARFTPNKSDNACHLRIAAAGT